VIFASIDLEGQPGCVSLNVNGLSEHTQLAIEILDERFLPVEGHAAEECAPLESGFQQRVTWKEHERTEKTDGAIRIRINYAGIRPEDPQIYAIYVEQAVTYWSSGVYPVNTLFIDQMKPECGLQRNKNQHTNLFDIQLLSKMTLLIATLITVTAGLLEILRADLQPDGPDQM
jgi:hypothetical protein